MSTSGANGHVQRKSLAMQLDRLDTILDGLADGLNEAVATVVKEAVLLAVEAALKEVLTNSDLQRRLRPEPIAAEPTVAKPSMARRAVAAIAGGLRSCWFWLAAKAKSLHARTATFMRETVPAIMVRVRRGMSSFGRHVWLGTKTALSMARHFRKPLVIAVVIGTLIGVGCFFAGPTVASLVSGLAGFITSLAASAMNRLRRMLMSDELEDWSYESVR